MTVHEKYARLLVAIEEARSTAGSDSIHAKLEQGLADIGMTHKQLWNNEASREFLKQEGVGDEVFHRWNREAQEERQCELNWSLHPDSYTGEIGILQLKK